MTRYRAFPKHVIQQHVPRSIPDNIRYVYDKVFEAQDAGRKFGGYNPDLPVPYGKKSNMTKGQEYEAFLRFNYARYRASLARGRASKIAWLSKAGYYKAIIVHHNMGLAYYWAGKLKNCGDYETLCSEASYKLCVAVDGFDISFGFRFNTYASNCIRRGIFSNDREFKRRYANFKPRELVDDAAVDTRIVHSCDINRLMSEMDVQSMVFDNSGLNDSEKYILVSRYGIGGCAISTLREIGKRLGKTSERVRQIQDGAKRKILEQYGKDRNTSSCVRDE